MTGRYSQWVGAVALATVLGQTAVVRAGVADTPLPNFTGGATSVAVYYAVGVIKNNGLETDFVCTNTDTVARSIGLEVFDETGALRNTMAGGAGEFLNVGAGRTVTVSTGGTVVLHEDTSLLLNLLGTGLNQLRNGSGRIVATSKNISCTAVLADKFHSILDPALSAQAAPTIANLPLIKLP